jgi:FkbM family methyltransferase
MIGIKHFLKILVGKEIFVKKDLVVRTKWFGNINAGFYVFPDLINESSVVYSFGVGEDVSFDEQLITSFNCKVFGFDPTPKSIDFIESKTNLSSNYYFQSFGLFSYDGDITFLLPVNPNHVSCTVGNVRGYDEAKLKKVDVPVLKFDTIIKKLGHSKIDILKLDIEGSEYEVLNDILKSSIQIDQICIEFHHRFKGISKMKTIQAIKSLKDNGYLLIAISKQAEEFTFIRKEALKST